MLEDHRWFFMITSTVMIVALIVYYFAARPKDWVTVTALAFITGGGIGNMIDRILLGYVVDFVDFTLINFAVFNVADAFVCIGVGFMCLALILETRAEARKRKTAAQDLPQEDENDNTPADR